MTHKIAVVVGSLRKDSWSKKVAHALKALAPDSLILDIVEIGAMPVYNEDSEGNDTQAAPQAWTDFRASVAPAVGCIFVTPEYNRTIPGGMKNALDVGSRPFADNIWSGKATAVLSLSPGPLGGFWANHNLRQSASILNMSMMAYPEGYLSSVHTLFTEKGELTPEAHTYFTDFLASYAQRVEKIA